MNRKLGIIALMALAVLALILVWIAPSRQPEQPSPSPPPQEKVAKAPEPARIPEIPKPPSPKPTGLGFAHYRKVKTGMTYDEVVGLIGPPTRELSRQEKAGKEVVMYQWAGGRPESGMKISFKEGRVVYKAQSGLR